MQYQNGNNTETYIFFGLPGTNNNFKLPVTENSSLVQILQKFFNDGC